MNSEDVIYVHCHDIDRMMEQNPRDFYVYGEPGVSYDDTDYDEQIDALLEHFRGNAAPV